ncbi:MAG: hypothetical protein NZ872_02700 [Archaeoglobaceae archaeon]|nr:hypothetical protein [Archaeoglobaceae archaeon]MDW8128107.1 hypothetical protein [Archaeoglobaceae archaeon]
MLYEVLSILFGFGIGFIVTWRFVEIGVRREEEKIGEARKIKMAEVAGKIESAVEALPEKLPSSLDELLKYISGKYMLSEVTLLTPDGLPIASNSSTPEEDTANAPEFIKVANQLLNSDRIVLAGGDNRIVVLQINPDVLLYAKVARELSRPELEKLRGEVNKILEELI